MSTSVENPGAESEKSRCAHQHGVGYRTHARTFGKHMLDGDDGGTACMRWWMPDVGFSSSTFINFIIIFSLAFCSFVLLMFYGWPGQFVILFGRMKKKKKKWKCFFPVRSKAPEANILYEHVHNYTRTQLSYSHSQSLTTVCLASGGTSQM